MSDGKEKGGMTVAEAGRKGGNQNAEVHDTQYFQELGKKPRKKRRAGDVKNAHRGHRASGAVSGPSSDPGTMTVSEAGRKGGQATSEAHGHEFYQRIGKKGAEKSRTLMLQGVIAKALKDGRNFKCLEQEGGSSADQAAKYIVMLISRGEAVPGPEIIADQLDLPMDAVILIEKELLKEAT